MGGRNSRIGGRNWSEHADDALVTVLGKMTQRNPQDRYRNLREVLSALSETSRRIAVPSESVFGGRSGYARIHDIDLAPFGRSCRDFQNSRDMSTVGFRAGSYELHLVDVKAAKSVISINIGVPFRYKVSADGKWAAVQVHRCPSIRGLGLPEGGVFVIETSTGELTVLLDNAALSPSITKEVEKVRLDEDSSDDLLLFSPQSQRLFLGLHTGLIMSWCCESWERTENYRKERGSSIKFNVLIPGGEELLLAGDGSNFVVFREGDGDPQGELSIPTRSRGQRVIPWDGKNTWVSHRAELFDEGKHLIAISSCDLEDSLPRATTHSVRELTSSPVSDVAACAVVGLVATISVGESFVRVYNADLKQVDVLSTPSSPARVIFSPRGNYLFVCGGEAISVFRRG